jgi:hypothetical protein
MESQKLSNWIQVATGIAVVIGLALVGSGTRPWS